ncbi:TlpA disulfide reductase family protein [uncultured Eudoraea sp.]|uniref:TlpA disulfide reductase family protein n=1 Tax=uncultured Eudoraea sp. TaxID=1035614 RepID=UPI00262D46A5|nr:TlpA disulfide reductase family protein [uncultured Eudoraea sp.]
MIRLVLFLSILVLTGCDFKERKKSTSENSEFVSTGFATADSLGIPVYNFDDLETLLYTKDDKTYIINFWATWCAPCIKELPYFEKINQQGEANNWKVILVSLDMPSMWKSKLIPFIRNKDLQSEVVILDDPDQNSWIPKVDKNWSGAIPATLIYNRNKRKFYEQTFTYEMLNKELGEFK